MKWFFVFLCLLLIPQTCYSASMESLALLEDSFSKVAAEVGTAVVSVTVVQVYTFGGKQYYYPYRSFDPFLDEFLREFFESPREYRQSGLGSGVIIDKEGYILTNEHVVSDAREIEVTLSDGRKFKGTVKGADSRSDLAVIKIDAENLPAVKLGDSDKVRVGEWVVAMGNPFGFIITNPQPTITVGVISALHRNFAASQIDEARYYGDLIQTDAAINRGNSGGPLVNIRGEVIGVNALIYSTTGGYQGIGFAIPINRAKKILEELISGKEIKYGWLGVQVQSLTPDLISLFGLPDNKGALVAEVIAGGPAAEGGMKKGDLVRKIDDREIIIADDLVSVVSHLTAGHKSDVLVLRNGKEKRLEIIIGEKPDEGVIMPEKEPSLSAGWRGIQVVELTPQLKQQLEIEEETGVIAARLEKNSPGDRSGVREGDFIDEVNRQEVRNVEEFQKAASKARGEVLVHTGRGYFVVREK